MFNFIQDGFIYDLTYGKQYPCKGVENGEKIENVRYTYTKLDPIEKVEKTCVQYFTNKEITEQVKVDGNRYKLEITKIDNNGNEQKRYFLLTIKERV